MRQAQKAHKSKAEAALAGRLKRCSKRLQSRIRNGSQFEDMQSASAGGTSRQSFVQLFGPYLDNYIAATLLLGLQQKKEAETSKFEKFEST